MTYVPQVLSYEDLRGQAEEFLSEYHPSLEIPTPIEEIVEFDFEMDVIPVEGLKQELNVDAFLASDLSAVFVDDDVLQFIPVRYRFSLAGLILVPPASLKARFTRRVEEALQAGLKASDLIVHPLRHKLVEGLAQDFKVSEMTMAIRLEKDGLLPPLVEDLG